jgi:hypothetical protein
MGNQAGRCGALIGSHRRIAPPLIAAAARAQTAPRKLASPVSHGAKRSYSTMKAQASAEVKAFSNVEKVGRRAA